MLYQVLAFLIEIAVTLIGGACLLRLYMGWRRMSMGNPVGRFVQALSDWLGLPLQRMVSAAGRWDVASLLGAWLLKLLQYAALVGMLELGRWSVLPLLALLGVAKLAVSVATAVIIVAAVLSWTGNRTPVRDVFVRLCEPLLARLRQRVPLVGGGKRADAASCMMKKKRDDCGTYFSCSQDFPCGKEVTMKEAISLKLDIPEGYKVLFRPWITLKNGTRLYARAVGKRAFPLIVKA